VANGEVIVTGAVEGDVDEAVLRRVLEHVGLSLGAVHGRAGKQKLLQHLSGYNNAARFAPWVALIDLDSDCPCAPPCVQEWLRMPSRLMCFRVAVRAVEAWLLADRERIASSLVISPRRVPVNPDGLPHPKTSLVNLARQSKSRAVREDFVPREGSGRSVGPLYTARLMAFVENHEAGWRPERAAAHSESLRRCIERLRSFPPERQVI
jgi:hypothetical protein